MYFYYYVFPAYKFNFSIYKNITINHVKKVTIQSRFFLVSNDYYSEYWIIIVINPPMKIDAMSDYFNTVHSVLKVLSGR